MGSNFGEDDNQLRPSPQDRIAFVARFQTLNGANIEKRTVVMHGSHDDSAGCSSLRVLFASRARGMNVAPCLRKILEGDLEHAVDNFSDPTGLVADWLAFACGRRPDSPASRGGGHYP